MKTLCVVPIRLASPSHAPFCLILVGVGQSCGSSVPPIMLALSPWTNQRLGLMSLDPFSSKAPFGGPYMVHLSLSLSSYIIFGFCLLLPPYPISSHSHRPISSRGVPSCGGAALLAGVFGAKGEACCCYRTGVLQRCSKASDQGCWDDRRPSGAPCSRGCSVCFSVVRVM